MPLSATVQVASAAGAKTEAAQTMNTSCTATADNRHDRRRKCFIFWHRHSGQRPNVTDKYGNVQSNYNYDVFGSPYLSNLDHDIDSATAVKSMTTVQACTIMDSEITAQIKLDLQQ